MELHVDERSYHFLKCEAWYVPRVSRLIVRVAFRLPGTRAALQLFGTLRASPRTTSTVCPGPTWSVDSPFRDVVALWSPE